MPKHDLLLLNPDAILQPGALNAMRTALEDNARTAAVGAVQFSLDIQTIDGLGDAYHFTGLPWRSAFGAPASQLTTILNDHGKRTSPIFSACGAAALYRRCAWDAANGFDIDYFCYCEDVDLGFRLRLAGWDCLRANAAHVLHAGSLSTGKDSDFSVYHGHRNLVWTFVKNMPTVLLALFLLPHLLMNALAMIHYLLLGRGKTIAHAKWDAFKGLPGAWKKRARIHQSRRISSWQLWKILSKSPLKTKNA